MLRTRAAGANVTSGSGNNSTTNLDLLVSSQTEAETAKPTRTVPWCCIFMIRVGGHNARRVPGTPSMGGAAKTALRSVE